MKGKDRCAKSNLTRQVPWLVFSRSSTSKSKLVASWSWEIKKEIRRSNWEKAMHDIGDHRKSPNATKPVVKRDVNH